jgi:hypothetical protein
MIKKNLILPLIEQDTPFEQGHSGSVEVAQDPL